MWKHLLLAGLVGLFASGNRVWGDSLPALINLDLGEPMGVKTGPAVVGQGTNDFWNVGWYSPVANVRYANGAVSFSTISIINGMFGGYCGSTDPMYDSYVFDNGYASSVSVVAANLIPGVYDIYAYSPSAGFTLVVGTNNLGSRSCSDSPLANPPVWQEGQQYVRYTNVTIAAGDTVTLTSGGLGKISGLQIAGVQPALALLDQPQSLIANAGDSVTLLANAVGTGTVLYQWQLEGTNLPGATTASLALTNLVFAQQGNYSVLVSNSLGAISSSNAFLTVQAPPVIHLQPNSLTLGAGSDTMLLVAADGSPALNYQWFFQGSALNGATNSSLPLTNVQAAGAGDYALTITNAFGWAVSDPAHLSVTNTGPGILASPQSMTVTRGAPAQLRVLARGTDPLSYIWTRDSSPLPGQTAATIFFDAVQPTDAGTYRATVTNSYGLALSDPATVTVTPPPGFLWAGQIGGTGQDEAKAVAADGAGNVYVAGYFNGTAAFGSTSLVSAGGWDIFLAKYDRFGQLLWARQAGSTSLYQNGGFYSEVAFSLAADAAGNAYITGSFTGAAKFGDVALSRSAGGAAMFLAKYSPAGDVLWAIQSGGSGNAQGNALSVGPDGSILAAGVFTGTNTLGTNSLSLAATSTSNAVFVARFNSDGAALWARKGAGNGKGQARAVATAPDGTVYVTGDFTGALNFDGIDVFETAANEPNDIFVAAYEPGGNVLWVNTAGGFYADSGAGIGSDAMGNVYVTGSFKNLARFGDISLSIGGGPGMFLAKYARDGKVQWVRKAGGGGLAYGNSVAVDSGGNAFVAGSFYSAATFGSTNLSSYGGEDAFVAMYTAAGDLVWALDAGSSGTDSAASVFAGPDGNIYLAGTFSAAMTLGNASLPGAGGKDAFVAKVATIDPDLPPSITLQPSNQTLAAGDAAALSVGFIGGQPLGFQWRLNGADLPDQTNAVLDFSAVGSSQAGDYSLVISNAAGAVTSAVATVSVAADPDYVWSRGAGGPGDDEALAVAMDSFGNTYAAGYFSGTATFAGTSLVSAGGEDIFVAKYDKAGNLMWVTQAGGSADERATGLALDNTGTRVLVTGYFNGTANFGVTSLTSAGGTDIFIGQLDPQGHWVWASQAGGPLNDAALGVAVDDQGSAVITGFCQSTAHFDNITFSGNASIDVFVAKYNTAGRVIWARNAGGTSQDTGRAIACDHNGHIYVAGSFYGTAIFGSFSLTSAADLSVFVAQYSSSSGNVLWARQAGAGSLSDAEGLALCADREGNALVAGYFSNQALFGSNVVTCVTSNTPDLFLAKYDVNGNLFWVQPAGGIFSDYGNSLATDGCGNAYLAATFSGTARFADRTLASLGGSDAAVALYDAAGQLLKVRRGGGSGNDAAQAVAADGKGGAVLAGYYSSQAALGADLLANSGACDAFVSRLQMFASNAAPAITTSPATQSVLFGSNAVFMVGVSSGTAATYQWWFNGARIVNATNSFLRVTNAQYGNMGDYYVVVSNTFGSATSAVARLTTDLSPDFIWARGAGGVQDDSAQAVAADAQGNLFVAGYFKTSATFGTVGLTNAGQQDVFLAKYDTNATLLWVAQAGGVSDDAALGLAVDAAGNAIVAGTFSSARADFGPYTLTNAGAQDIFLAKYDPQGSVLWARQAGYIGADQANAVAVDSTGNIYLTGFGGYITSIGGIWLTNSIGTNFVVAKYDPSGNALWAKTAFGSGTCLGSGITVDRETNILVTGYLIGRSDFGSGVLVNTNPGFYGATVFLANYDPQGGLRWAAKGIGGSTGYGQNIKADADGNIFATATMYGYGNYPSISKYDSAGRRLWTRGGRLSCCTGDSLSADGLALDAQGNPCICGLVTGSAFLDGNNYYINHQGYIAKYRSTDGALFWGLVAGQGANAVTMDRLNNTYVAGRFTGLGRFGLITLTNAGSNDAFITRIGVTPPGIGTSPVSQNVVVGSNAVLRVNATGTGPLGYQWLFNGTAINGATNSTYTINNFLPGNAGAYSVIVQNSSGSLMSSPAVLTLIPVLQISPAGDTVVLVWLGNFVLQSATNPAGPYVDLAPPGTGYTNETAAPQQFFRLRAAPAGGTAGAVSK